MSVPRPQNLVRLSGPELDELLERLERGEERAAHRERRTHPRLSFRRGGLLLSATHPGGGTSHFLVHGRNISAGGIAFLHGSFVHRQTRALLILPRLDGGRQPVTGQVIDCRHVQGLLHEVRIRFEPLIAPASFVEISGSEGPSFITADGKVDPMHMLERYIENTREIGLKLEQALEAQNLDEVRCMCLSIGGSAGKHGFEPLADAAASALAALEAAGPVDETLRQVRLVAKLCRRLSRK